ncbi:MAG: universal stress protein [Mycetocola sp.]
MIKKTVVAWDGSEGAAAALDWALARPSTEELVLVHVDNAVALAETFAANSTAAAARITLMEKADSVRRGQPDRIVHSELVQGDPAVTLAGFASATSLVVLGTRGSTARKTRRSWSLGGRVAGLAAGPVAVVPVQADRSGTSIVVGVDDPEEAAVLFAAEEAARTGATLRPIRAWQVGPPWPGQTETDSAYLESLAEMYRDLVDDSLATVLERYPDVVIEPAIVQGNPVEVLIDASAGARMLVVGNRGFRGLKRFFLGSVSHAVLLSTVVPTVVVNARRAG